MPNGYFHSCWVYFNIILFLILYVKSLTLTEYITTTMNILVVIGEGGEHFVADDGTVYKVPHQAYETIYQYDSQGNVVKQYPYIADEC